MEDKVYFYLPGFVEFFDINMMLLMRMADFPDHFYPNVNIGGVFGCPPGAKWNGGRCCLGYITDESMQKAIEAYNMFNIPIRYTWTNPTLTSEEYQDEYCNKVTAMAHNGFNEILVNDDKLEEYIREHFPKYPLISSTTKRITDIDALNEELNKDYKLVVIDYDFNNNWEFLNQIQHPERCEILVNAVCNPKCPYRKAHYYNIGMRQRGIDIRDENVDSCMAQGRFFCDVQKLSTYISPEQIYGEYYDKGFRHFKLEGRGSVPMKVIEYYIHYLVLPEYQTEEREWLQLGMHTLLTQPNLAVFDKKPSES